MGNESKWTLILIINIASCSQAFLWKRWEERISFSKFLSFCLFDHTHLIRSFFTFKSLLRDMIFIHTWFDLTVYIHEYLGKGNRFATSVHNFFGPRWILVKEITRRRKRFDLKDLVTYNKSWCKRLNTWGINSEYSRR